MRHTTKRILRKLFPVLLMLVLMFSLSACANFLPWRNSSSSDDSGPGYNIYYIDKGGSSIKPVPYMLKSTKEVDIINECLEALRTDPDDKDCQAVLNDTISISSVDYPGDDKTVGLHFTESYNNLSKTQEILTRAAIVKTLTQFSGIVNYVSFCIGDNWMTDSEGNTLKMSSGDFATTLNISTEKFTKEDFVLYYATTDGKGLKTVVVTKKYDQMTSPEQVILNSLIRGKTTDTTKPPLSKNTQIRSVYNNDGVCYVDFNSGFLEKVDGQDFRVNVYSVVDSLTELDYIDSVKITVEGSEVENGPDNVSLSGELKPDYSLLSD